MSFLNDPSNPAAASLNLPRPDSAPPSTTAKMPASAPESSDNTRASSPDNGVSQHLQLVQPEDYSNYKSSSGNTTPVFLIHDGGGTIYSYHCLGRLYRFIYGIKNPFFYTGGTYPGGIPEMARVYAQWIKEMTQTKDFPIKRNPDDSMDIILGGWSLGGLLSLEIASILDEDFEVRVVGIVMIDSLYPRAAVGAGSWHPEEPKTKNEVLSRRCMTEARQMVAKWTLPDWSLSLDPRPPTVLIKCRHKITSENPENGLHTLDTVREDKVLGWSAYDKDMFVRVIETDGHHFNLFKDDYIRGTTMALRKALASLDP